MKNLRVLLGAVAFALLSCTVASAQTPGQTPAPKATSTQGLFTPAPSPSPFLSKRVGTSANWIKQIEIGSCAVNPPSIAAGASVLVNCTVNGAATTDKVFVNVQPPNTSTHTPFVIDECWYVQGAKVVAADTIQFRFVNRELGGPVLANAACDPPLVTVDYFQFRPNTTY